MTGRSRVLTGVKPTGVPHIGNYLGAIEPAIKLGESHDSFLFIADLHALTTKQDPKKLTEETYAVAAAWLAFGLDPEKVVFYRQSDVPEIPVLAWVLGCMLPKGMLERAHSYKDALQKGQTDDDVNVGLFSYPVLMAADILLFDTDVVPVGKDQKQHLEICQEAARKFNHTFGETLKIPKAQIDESVMTVPGLDGRKMSKSYDNYITVLGVTEKHLQKKMINKIVCDSTPLGEPLEPKGNVVAELYQLLGTPEKVRHFLAQCRAARVDPADDASDAFGWGSAKKALFELMIERFGPARSEYDRYMADRGELEALLKRGADRAREVGSGVLDRVLRATGTRPA